MGSLGAYLIRLSAAAVFCGVVTGLVGSQGTMGRTVKLLAAVFMTLTFVYPLADIRFVDLKGLLDDISFDATGVVAEGQELAAQAIAEVITEKTQAYILDEAAIYGADIRVSVTLAKEGPPVPESVTIRGAVSPYVRQQLSAMIQNDLGIEQEGQIWIIPQ